MFKKLKFDKQIYEFPSPLMAELDFGRFQWQLVAN